MRRTEAKYRDLIDVSPDAIYIIDTDLTFVLANPAGAQLAGCTQEELIGTPIAGTFLPEERPLLPARMEMMKTEPYLRFERKFVRRNGDIVPVEVSLTTVRSRYLQAVLRDISERKRSEEALRASEQVARGRMVNFANFDAAANDLRLPLVAYYAVKKRVSSLSTWDERQRDW